MGTMLETRELAHFLAVADELHFGRAAARLGIAQPALSRTVQKLERRLGVVLFDRGSRGVTITPAGLVLAREARRVLTAVQAAARRTERAASRDRGLVLALKAGGDFGLLPAVLAAFARQPESRPVRVVFEADRGQLLRDGRADAALLFEPSDDLHGFDVEPLRTDTRMAVLPASHPLAARREVRLADLPDEYLPGPDGDRTPRRAAAPGNPAPASVAELLQLVALGQAIAVVPRSLAAAMPLRHDVTGVPVVDAAPVTLLLAWPAHTRSPSLAALARAAAAVRTGRDPAVR
ncbi:LysR family transcriptional regulator [Actinocatenispora thailandica]|uniref:LysR family transcriptional regulator n=1 Tax=Actinocatenispora thailandica TaxID=227318 RepID=A0A7R7DL20_9ACTN|nr:LysR family transcriptional regulator [Actinocatenispora thailandica]BCJ33704.1 LysR family transcriptional regulator [Actinocatenispora thailandica]